ncbi:MAG: hypothetical protein ABI591_11030 [Kofleriaceae bacterium]
MRYGAIALVGAIVCVGQPVYADGRSEPAALAVARHDVDGSDYLAARGALVSALDSGTAGPEELAEIYKLSGIVEAALGNDDAATEAFDRWLSIDPKGILPAGTSPKIMRPFDSAAATLKAREPLKVKVETSASPPSVTLVVVNDPDKLITRAQVFVVADGKPEAKIEGAGTARITLALPHGERLDLRLQALDAHGNRVVELGSTDVPIVITGGAPLVATTKPVIRHRDEPIVERPLVLRWWLWTGVAVAFGGAGTYFGLQARDGANQLSAFNAASQQHVFTEATELASTTRRDALFFNIGMGAAGVFAIGATVLYLTRPHMETRVSVVPQRDGGAVVFGGAF